MAKPVTQSVHVLSEKLVPLPALAARLGVHVSAPTRWWRDGIKRADRVVHLEAVKIAGRVFTSEEAFQRFLTTEFQDISSTPDLPRTPDRRRRVSERAAQQLRELGV
jgi:hypothetical protein